MSWILVDPRVTSRGGSSPPECLILSISLLPEFGATNEIKTLALFPSLPEYTIPASEKIYVEGESDLISFTNVFKSLEERINRRSRGTAGIVATRQSSPLRDIEVTHGKPRRNRLTSKSDFILLKVMWVMFLFSLSSLSFQDNASRLQVVQLNLARN